MAELPSNPVPFTVLEDEEHPFRIGLELEVYAYDDPFTPIDVIPYRPGLNVLDEVEGPGAGSFKIFSADPKLAESPEILDYENLYRVRLDRKIIGAFFNQKKESDFVNRQEKSGEFFDIAGGGLREWFHDAVVEPYRGIKSDSQSDRYFSFASERGTWYKTADWTIPKRIQKHNLDPNDGPFGTAPAEWPDAPSAYWIWGEVNSAADPAPEGINYFRHEFTISSGGANKQYAFFAAARQQFDVFLDGQRIIEAYEDDAYAQTWRADFELAAGPHVLAVRVKAEGTHPAGFIGAFYRAGDAEEGTSAVLLNVTDNDGEWRVNSYPDPAPGWTPGEIMLTLLAEAEARGVRFPTFLTPTFTATHDSDGSIWSTELDWSFPIGTEYYDVIEKLEELACDLWIDPETYELNMYATRGVHRDTQSMAAEPIKFEIGKNVIRAKAEGISAIKNALLMSTEDGWQKVADGTSDSIAKYGRREGYVSTGASGSVSTQLAAKIFKQKAKPEDSATYEIIDVDGARPFFDFQVGDWVLAPDEKNSYNLVPRRVMSIAVEEDSETGQPKFAIEFDTILQDRAARYDRWLKTASDGTLNGTLANVSTGGGGGGGTPSAQAVRRGPMGLVGPAGPQGPPGEALDFQGMWNAAQPYVTGQVVTWESGQWVALTANVASEPSPSNDDWELMLSDGTVVFKRVLSLDETIYPVELIASSTAVADSGTTLNNTVSGALPGDLVVAAIMHRSNLTLPAGWTLIGKVGPTPGDATANQISFAYLRVSVAANVSLLATVASSARILSNLHVLRNAAIPTLDTDQTQLILDAPNPPANTISFTNPDDGDVRLWAALSNIWNSVAPWGAWTATGLDLLIQHNTGTTAPRLVTSLDSGPSTARGLRVDSAITNPDVAVLGALRIPAASQYAIWVGPQGEQGEQGDQGDSAYQVAVDNGFVGSEAAWLLSLKGADGADGASLIYRGPWDSGASYVANDLVTHEDRLWITNNTNSNSEPGIGADWEAATPGGGSSSMPSRGTVTYTSASLAPDASETGVVALGRSYRVLKVELSRQGRVRLYDTIAHRDDDVGRAKNEMIDATTDHGLMLDVALATGSLTRTMTPLVDGVNFELGINVPITVTNLDLSAGTVAVTLTFIKTED